MSIAMEPNESENRIMDGMRDEAKARGIDIDPDSPFNRLITWSSLSTQVQISELAGTADTLLALVADSLHIINPHPDQPPHFATLAETADRWRRAEETPARTSRRPAAETTASSADCPDGACTGPCPVCGIDPGQDPSAHQSLPGFPRYRPDETMTDWVHGCTSTDLVSEFATIRGATTALTLRHLTTSMLIGYGLPLFCERCTKGDFTIDHINAVNRLCQNVGFEHLPEIDAYLSRRRADVTMETFAKSLTFKIAATEPKTERDEQIAQSRRVTFSADSTGTGYLTLVGPSAELETYHRRIEAFARTIRANNTNAFGDQLEPGDSFEDDRGLQALMFDIVTCTQPRIKARIRRGATTVGSNPRQTDAFGAADAPADLDVAQSLADRAEIRGSGHSASHFDSETMTTHLGELIDDPSIEEVFLDLPTKEQWFDLQARMLITVPFMSLLGESELPAFLPSGAPIGADVARTLAGHSKTWTRILTDPATGTPIDAKAHNYSIPESVRHTLIGQWGSCTAPGCTKQAVNAEIDHILPFDHDDPASGGLTVFGNLHPACKRHHQAKTDRKIHVRQIGPCHVEYSFPHGVRVKHRAPDNAVNCAQAEELRTLSDHHHRAHRPPSADPPGTLPGDLRSSTAHLENRSAPPTDIPDDCHRVGETTTSATPPGPEAGEGRPGWAKKSWPFGDADDGTPPEWFWDSGQPPPF